MEYKIARADADMKRVLGATTQLGWTRCGPEGGTRMMKSYMDAGPIGRTHFLTVNPMVAYKLELIRILPAGLIYKRCSGKMPDWVFAARPRGTVKVFNVELFQESPKVQCRVYTSIGGHQVLEKQYPGLCFLEIKIHFKLSACTAKERMILDDHPCQFLLVKD